MNRDAFILYVGGGVMILIGVGWLTRSTSATMIVAGILAIGFARWAESHNRR